MFAWTQDLHLQTSNWRRYPKLAGDAYRSFAWIVGQCCERKVSALIVGGDIFQSSTPSSQAFDQFKRGAELLHSHGIPIFYVQGQHDRADPPWPSTVPNTWHIHGKTVQIDGLNVYGLDHTYDKDELYSRLKNVPPGTDILIMHQTPTEALGSMGDLSLESIAGVKLVLLGDYHKAYEFENQAGVKFVSAGNTYMRSLDEDPQKYFLLVDGTDIQRRLIGGTRTVRRVVLETDADFKEFMDELPPPLPGYEYDKYEIWDISIAEELADKQSLIEKEAEFRAFVFMRTFGGVTVDQLGAGSLGEDLRGLIDKWAHPERQATVNRLVRVAVEADTLGALDAELDKLEKELELECSYLS